MNYADKIAVVTGGGTGMGRELVRQLAASGCHVAMCDVSEGAMVETQELALADAAAAGHQVRITNHDCDVADEAAVLRFRDEVVDQHETDHVNLVFNNAGISGGASVFENSRESWDRVFDICWGGVYFGTRAFLPLLVASTEGHLINTASVNSFWASLGPERPHTAYSAAKFAVRGFTEALLTDVGIHAPHVGVSVVMPGHIGTEIVANSIAMSDEEIPEELKQFTKQSAEDFRDNAPVSAAEAATVILEAVKAGKWRILIGADAEWLDAAVRADPEAAYSGPEFLIGFQRAGGKDPDSPLVARAEEDQK